ncbi:MAG: LuxR C-terminal-related transcriptional regulator, partial [Treponema sp.]|nr:LuxR C-terminal-related transcriptional regulator [Treponema sp.]
MEENTILTSREQEILNLLIEGDSIKKIASRLNISVKTLDTHRTNIYRKLDVHNYRELLNKFSPENRLLDHPQISEHFNKTNKRFKILIPAIIMN